MDDHIRHIDQIFKTLTEAGVTLNINKCHIFQRKVEYLVHMLKDGFLEINKTNVTSLTDAQPRRT